jgi:hypothetical protein
MRLWKESRKSIARETLPQLSFVHPQVEADVVLVRRVPRVLRCSRPEIIVNHHLTGVLKSQHPAASPPTLVEARPGLEKRETRATRSLTKFFLDADKIPRPKEGWMGHPILIRVNESNR